MGTSSRQLTSYIISIWDESFVVMKIILKLGDEYQDKIIGFSWLY